MGEVSLNMEDQLQNINNAKANVDTVYEDVNSMADKARTVTETSGQTAEAAQKGSALMETAIKRMGNIEKSVLASADVVRKLGENSNQIGQIVEAISSARRRFRQPRRNSRLLMRKSQRLPSRWPTWLRICRKQSASSNYKYSTQAKKFRRIVGDAAGFYLGLYSVITSSGCSLRLTISLLEVRLMKG